MAFPVSSVLDAFTRADQTPLGGSWSGRVDTDDGDLSVVTNAVANAVAATVASAAWGLPAGSDQEAYVTIAVNTDANDEVEVWARLTPGATPSGYCARFVSAGGADTLALYRVDAGVFTQLSTTSSAHEFSPGDKFGIECVGSTISLYSKVGAAAWVQRVTAVDATYAAGSIGLRIRNVGGTAMRVDDFAGSVLVDVSAFTVPPGSGPHPARMPLGMWVPETMQAEAVSVLGNTFSDVAVVTGDGDAATSGTKQSLDGVAVTAAGAIATTGVAGETHFGTVAITGDGDAAATTIKGGVGAAATAAGGLVAATAAKNATGATSTGAGGTTAATGAHGALDLAAVTTAGLVAAAGAHQTAGAAQLGAAGLTGTAAFKASHDTAAASGGGSVAATGTTAEAHTGTCALGAAGGVAVLAVKGGDGASILDGGGLPTTVGARGALAMFVLVGGGSATLEQLTARYAAAALTGGGLSVATGDTPLPSVFAAITTGRMLLHASTGHVAAGPDGLMRGEDSVAGRISPAGEGGSIDGPARGGAKLAGVGG